MRDANYQLKEATTPTQINLNWPNGKEYFLDEGLNGKTRFLTAVQ